MASSPISNYTNCIYTYLWGDGVDRTPSMLFTYNQQFRRDRNPTPRGNDQVDYLNERLQHFGIDPSRVVYVGKDRGEKEHYVRESPELVRIFFEHYKDVANLPATTVLSDEGNSFFEKGESVFESLGVKKHITYPPREHQYLSPNDNSLHGTGKQSLRTSGADYSDDVDSCLRLLHYFDRDTVKYSAHWFRKNILDLTDDNVAELIAARSPKMSHLHKHWLRSYRIFKGEDARGPMPELPDRLDDGLDGLYWSK
jgi:hypothetical protein